MIQPLNHAEPAMSVNSTPKKPAPDSPSRQLLYELNRLFISEQEQFLSRLDYENEQRENIHRQALAAAAEYHEKVRESAALERQRFEEQVQAERDRRDAEARLEIEQRRREKAERELEEKQREIERTQAIENEKRRLAELERSQKEAAEAARLRKQRDDEEEARKARARQNAELQKQQIAQKPPQGGPTAPSNTLPEASTTPTKTPPASVQSTPQILAPTTSRSAAVTTDPSLEGEHTRYLGIHKQLKELRQFMINEGKKNKGLKDAMGDMRRDMRKSVGQLTEGKGANRQPLQNICATLRKASGSSGPRIPISRFLVEPPPNSSTDGDGPALLVYLLNIFSKALISQWIDEAGVKPEAADPVGIIASHIFARAEFRWHDMSLISILLAKLHKTCPVLFGIYGPENTVQGKTRLGWWQDENGWLSRQRHYERMTGLASGFAALSLRNYEKSQLKNPYPEFHYWQALARMANTPVQELTQTHFVVIKGMVEHYEAKFIGFYGGAAVAALRFVLIDLPKRLPEDQKNGVAVKGAQALVEVLKRDSKLIL